MNDVPYVQAKHLQPETTAVMTRICMEVKKIIKNNIPCGVQVSHYIQAFNDYLLYIRF